MIELVGIEDRRRFGVAAALRLAGVPYRLGSTFAADARVAVVTLDDPTHAIAMRRGRMPLVVIGADDGRHGASPSSGTMALDAPIWSPHTRAIGGSLGIDAMELPRVRVAQPDSARGSVLATISDAAGVQRPAVVAAPGLLWCTADLGSAFADLLDEGHLPEPSPDARAGLLGPLFALYYRLPEMLRRWLQRRTYRALTRALAGQSDLASRYPVDATGWLLVELIVALVRRAAGGIVRVAPWPAPFETAATLTHDIEPTPFAYGPGLETLLDGIVANGHPAAVGLVAGPAARRLGAGMISRLAATEVYCHGLEHRGETLAGDGEAIAAGITAARDALGAQLGRPVEGFRSPRLDRSRTLLWALDRTGVRFDSSFPDVDRETVDRFGHGVRLCMPYRPPVTDPDGRVRHSRCLELPVSAPDCIQPLLAGEDEATLRAAVRAKVAFVRATGGLYTAIVHAGVFGPDDSRRRAAHLRFVAGLVCQDGVWLTRPSDLVAWWEAREQLEVRARPDHVVVTNRSTQLLRGVRLLVERDGEDEVLDVPALAAGETVRVAVGVPAGLSGTGTA